MRDTRQEILDTAKRLFNERGYNDVSTRDIAGELGISKGNLTYYFKRKEEIIETILTENPQTRMNDAPNTLAKLNIFFEDIQKTVQENAYYFWHHAQLAQISLTIRRMQIDVFNANIALLTKSFYILNEAGFLKNEHYSGEYRCVINTLLLSGIYWIPFCKLMETPRENFVEQAWSIVYPYLTNTGVNDFRAIAAFSDQRKPNL